jgi:pyridoxal 5'-phosphate synthase pdxT subunit
VTLHVGVLALQGDFAAHEKSVAALGHRVRQVRTAAPLDSLDALLLPGGESTTMLKFLNEEGLLAPLADFCRSGRPVFGTCAGAILLASDVTAPAQESLGIVDMTVERNAYGRQVDSFITHVTDVAPDAASLSGVEAVFIRAPVIRRTGPAVEVLLRHDGHPILVRQGSVYAATFHPEMTDDTRVLALVLQGGA